MAGREPGNMSGVRRNEVKDGGAGSPVANSQNSNFKVQTSIPSNYRGDCEAFCRGGTRIVSQGEVPGPRRDHCAGYFAGDSRAAEVFVRSGPGLLAAWTGCTDAFRRRKPAHSSGRTTGLEP